MMLILIAAFAISLGYLALARRPMMSSIPCVITHIDVAFRTGTSDRFWRRRAFAYRNAIVLTLLMAAVVIWITRIQSQTNAPAKSPANPGFYLTQGEDFTSNRQYDRAIEAYTVAIELKSAYAEAYNDRGFAYYLKGDFKHAIADYTRAIELRPNYPKAFNSRGVAYMAGGYGAAKSVPDFDRAIELKPDFRYAYINRANARFLQHPWLSLQDFHRAGMHPERTVTILASVFLTFALVLTFLILRRRHIRDLKMSRLA